jgi:hypothetical protein
MLEQIKVQLLNLLPSSSFLRARCIGGPQSPRLSKHVVSSRGSASRPDVSHNKLNAFSQASWAFSDHGVINSKETKG